MLFRRCSVGYLDLPSTSLPESLNRTSHVSWQFFPPSHAPQALHCAAPAGRRRAAHWTSGIQGITHGHLELLTPKMMVETSTEHPRLQETRSLLTSPQKAYGQSWDEPFKTQGDCRELLIATLVSEDFDLRLCFKALENHKKEIQTSSNH